MAWYQIRVEIKLNHFNLQCQPYILLKFSVTIEIWGMKSSFWFFFQMRRRGPWSLSPIRDELWALINDDQIYNPVLSHRVFHLLEVNVDFWSHLVRFEQPVYTVNQKSIRANKIFLGDCPYVSLWASRKETVENLVAVLITRSSASPSRHIKSSKSLFHKMDFLWLELRGFNIYWSWTSMLIIDTVIWVVFQDFYC